MDELLNQFNFISQENFSLITFTTNILIATLILYILSYIYIKYGHSISNRNQLSRVLILIGLTTFIIISIVKSSLALSLGLVGALSIVRFRTAIKEPEELGFFFISISIGLGLGANQVVPTVIGFVVLLAVIIILNRGKIAGSITQNIIINSQLKTAGKDNLLDDITSILINNCNQVELKRLNHSKTDLNLNFIINVSKITNLQKISKELTNLDEGINITFLDNSI